MSNLPINSDVLFRTSTIFISCSLSYRDLLRQTYSACLSIGAIAFIVKPSPTFVQVKIIIPKFPSCRKNAIRARSPPFAIQRQIFFVPFKHVDAGNVILRAVIAHAAGRIKCSLMAQPCCERSEPTSAEGAVPRAWGAESPPRSAVNEHPAGCLFNRQNLALRENNRPSSCVSPSAVVVAGCLPQAVCAEGRLVTKWIY